MFIFLFFCLLLEGSEPVYGSVQKVTDPDPGGPNTNGSGSEKTGENGKGNHLNDEGGSTGHNLCRNL